MESSRESSSESASEFDRGAWCSGIIALGVVGWWGGEAVGWWVLGWCGCGVVGGFGWCSGCGGWGDGVVGWWVIRLYRPLPPLPRKYDFLDRVVPAIEPVPNLDDQPPPALPEDRKRHEIGKEAGF